jgi:circadian clock protein KaiC
LKFHAVRPTAGGLEAHLAAVHKLLRDFQPGVVVIDPISNLMSAGTAAAAHSMLMRIVDHLKMRQITGLFTSLSHAGSALEATDIGLSSLMDTWLLLRDIELNGERNRGLYVLKSRGMAHSNQIREFVLTRHGIKLVDVYLGPDGVLTGSARAAQEAREQSAEAERKLEAEARRRTGERKRKSLEAQLAALRAELEAEEEALQRLANEAARREGKTAEDRLTMARSRQAEVSRIAPKDGKKQGARK